MDFETERRALQIAVGTAALVPVTAGWASLIAGPLFLQLYGPAQSLTHAAYLSGLLLGLGLGFWSTIPGIEKQGRVFTLLTAMVMAGGLARAFWAVRLGTDGPLVIGPLAMELGVTPLLWRWQQRVARRSPK